MNAMTARGLSLAAVVAVWTAVSHYGKIPLQLFPAIVGLGCFVAAGGGIPGLQKAAAGMVSGVVWTLLYVSVSAALGRQELVDALVLGAAVFGMVFQARVPLLSFTAGALVGAGARVGAETVGSTAAEGVVGAPAQAVSIDSSTTAMTALNQMVRTFRMVFSFNVRHAT